MINTDRKEKRTVTDQILVRPMDIYVLFDRTHVLMVNARKRKGEGESERRERKKEIQCVYRYTDEEETETEVETCLSVSLFFLLTSWVRHNMRQARSVQTTILVRTCPR